MAFKFSIESNFENLEKEMLNDFSPGGAAQYTWSRIVFDGSVPYMPMLTWSFIKQSQAHSEPVMANGELVYPGPFAHYLWEGVLYIDPQHGIGAFFSEDFGFWSTPGVAKLKTSTPLEFNREANPNAGPRWTERAASDLLNKWIAEMERHIAEGFPMREG